MTLYEQLQEMRTAALKAGDNLVYTKLGTLLGEAKQVAMKKENRDPTDDEIITTVKKALEGIDEILKHQTDDIKRAPLLMEQALLMKFMPTQLSDNEIKVIIHNSGLNNLGKIMAVFKNHYKGKYDGSTVKRHAEEYLARSA
jgi:uncharacterized protein YqeY